jgi:LysM repeat protein
MGQLEKYGLYVLCLVIFLILGVTIWGGPDVAPSTPRSPASPMRANGAAEPTGSRENAPTVGASAPVGVGESADLASLLDQRLQPTESAGRQEPKAQDKSDKPVKPAADNATGGRPVDADARQEAAPVAAADQKRGVYKVQAGDTFDSIARKRLGGAGMVGELQKLNPKIVPSKLQVGTELVLPSPAELAAKKVAPAVAGAPDKPAADKSTTDKPAADKAIAAAGGERSYTIAKGDNFELIARRELGSARRVDELRDLNPALDPTRLKVGQRIKLPKK